ncbi:Carboxylic ester hydrolase [Aphelenchoides fujianensis]|nr:Carboxylic ester hydrolase [Aphelenchoides fujianensis]
MSGSSLAEWATSEKSVGLTARVAARLGCGEQSVADVKECLKEKSVEELLEAVTVVHEPHDFSIGQFSPRIDGAFFAAAHERLIAGGPPKRSLITTVENDGILFTLLGAPPAFSGLSLSAAQRAAWSAADFEAVVREKVAPAAAFGEDAAAIQARILDFYVYSSNRTKDRLFFLEQYAKLTSDLLVVVPQLREVREKRRSGWPVFLSKHTHFMPPVDFFTGRLPVDAPQQTTHGYEYGVLFETRSSPPNRTADDLRFQKNLLEMFVSFVKNGTPHSQFEAVSAERPLVYAEISTAVRLRNGLSGEELHFFDRFLDDFDFDLVRGGHTKTRSSRTEL